MINTKLVVVEANEVPLKVFQWFAERNPSSNIANLLAESSVITTEADDVPIEFLYPSQTWASFNTGASYSKHKINWYNDPKPAAYPLYYKILADNGRSVGLVNTLHTAPSEESMANSQIKFLIPDIYAKNSLVKPLKYGAFQKFNQDLSNQNRRVSSLRLGLREMQMGVKLPSLGVKLGTLLNTAKLLSQVATKRVTKERLRNIQFMLTSDMFAKMLKQNEVDLAVFFTNHIAGNMHRYWYASFPNEYSGDAHYDDKWVERHLREIQYAVALFDSFIGKMMKFCRSTGRVLIIVSSMGQYANPKLDVTRKVCYVIEDLPQFVEAFGVQRDKYDPQLAMYPQYTLKFKDAQDAASAFQTFQTFQKDPPAGIKIYPDLNDKVLTLSVHIAKDALEVLGKRKTISELGVKAESISDHHSGKHHPDGTLIINPRGSTVKERVTYLEFAPAVLDFFGVRRPEYMLNPSFKIQSSSKV